MRSPRRRLFSLLLVSVFLLAGLFLLIGIRPSREARAQTVPPTPTPTATPRHRPGPRPTPRPMPRPTAEPEEEEEEGPAQPARPAQPSVSAVMIPVMPMAMGPVTVTVVGAEDPAALSRFLRHLLAGYGPPGGVLTAAVGALPVDLPITLSLPAEVNVIGGYVRRGEYEETLLLLSSSGPAESVADIMRQDLLAQGYMTPTASMADMPGQVFLPNEPQFPEVLCSPDRRYVIFQSFSNLAGEPDALRVTINRSTAGDLCSPLTVAEGMTAGILPPLAPPPGAQFRSSGGGGGGNFVTAEAEIGTSMTVADLAAHYAAQLASAGWEQLDSSSAAAVEWSAWRLSDAQGNAWTATFYIAQKGDSPNAFLMTLRADAQP